MIKEIAIVRYEILCRWSFTKNSIIEMICSKRFFLNHTAAKTALTDYLIVMQEHKKQFFDVPSGKSDSPSKQQESGM